MVKCKHSTLILLSGLVWLAVGGMLLLMGVRLLNELLAGTTSFPLIDLLAYSAGGREEGAAFLVALSLVIGTLKARTVFRKTVNRALSRFSTLPNPLSLAKIYPLSTYILIASMMGVGLALRYFGVSPDIRALVLLTVGIALINGAIFYFTTLCSKENCQSK